MLRICCIIFSLILHSVVSAQINEVDVSSLPAASYTEKFWSVDRWGEVRGNIINVDFRYDEDSTITFAPSLIETVLAKDTATFILFPSSGSETDVFIYKINGTNQHSFEMDRVALKEKIFMWGAEPLERAIQINDLGSGYYYVSYVSCNYFGSYVLHIKE